MPQGPRNLAIAFGAESLTHYGGAYLLHRFFSWIGFKNALAMDVRLVQRNNRYSVGEMLLALLYPMILGLERVETNQLLRQNGVFQYLTWLHAIRIRLRCGDSCCRWHRRHCHNCAPRMTASFRE